MFSRILQASHATLLGELMPGMILDQYSGRGEHVRQRIISHFF
jgi:hypothetical protein